MHSTDSNFGPLISDQVILKVASKCNLTCTYCHWFRDPSVLKLPAAFDDRTIHETVTRLREFVVEEGKSNLTVVLHGGEPLLLPKKRFQSLCTALRTLEDETGCAVDIALTTNGVLVDPAWCEIFREFDVNPCVSLDGYRELHDKHRIDFKNRGSFDRTVRGIRYLQQNGFPNIGALCVFQPGMDPDQLMESMVGKLGIKVFDVLIPNFNHDDREHGEVPRIAEFYIRLFDLWLDRYAAEGVRIRCIESFIAAVFGRNTALSGTGFSPMGTVAIRPDGGIEPHDVLRISGVEQTETGLNVKYSKISEVKRNPVWKEAFDSSVSLPRTCQTCSYQKACHGGYLIHRFSSENRYANPSVYCEDLKKIYQYIWERVTSTLFVAAPKAGACA